MRAEGERGVCILRARGGGEWRAAGQFAKPVQEGILWAFDEAKGRDCYIWGSPAVRLLPALAFLHREGCSLGLCCVRIVCRSVDQRENVVYSP